MWYPEDHMLGLQRNGVNHVGMEGHSFDKDAGPVAGDDYPLTSDKLLDWYAKTMGMKSVRLLFSWEAVQNNTLPLGAPPLESVPPKVGVGYLKYWENLTGLVNRMIDRGMYVILCAYQHNSISRNTDVTYWDQSFTAEQFADFWSKFATAINEAVTMPPRSPWRSLQVGFDLINEPHERIPGGDVGITITNWFDCAQKAINAIRINPNNRNAIFVAGMGFASASNFVANGSGAKWAALTDKLNALAVTAHCYDGTRKPPGTVASDKPANILRTACTGLVDWARPRGVKVHVGEIAIDAGVNGCSTLALARLQWAEWARFCRENDDVLIGWNWWGNTQTPPWGWSPDGSCNDVRTWGLATNGGDNPSVYATLIRDSIRVPDLYIRDDNFDGGEEPNGGTDLAFQSPDIWIGHDEDHPTDVDPVFGGVPSIVFARVTNRGDGSYDGDGGAVVAFYWARASAGLGCPEPWNGKVNGIADDTRGGLIGAAEIGAIPAKQSALVRVRWPNTARPSENPSDGGDFALLAVITKKQPDGALMAFDHEGFECPQLNESVLKLRKAAMRNIEIVPAPKLRKFATEMLVHIVLDNPTGKAMRAQLAFEMLDAYARPLHGAGRLLIRAEPAVIERLGDDRFGQPSLQDLGGGRFALLDPATGIGVPDLRPGERLRFGLSFESRDAVSNMAIRAIQYAREGATRRIVGGRTFVTGHVEGITQPKPGRLDRRWAAAAALGTLLMLVALLELCTAA